MAKFNKNAHRFDPYKNFKFRVAQIVPAVTRDEIRLPEKALALLDEIVEMGRRGSPTGGEPGAGVHALFVGEKGTGKSTAGEVVANQLGLNLHRIDLAEVVDNYVGETEKNLDRLFEIAKETGAVLYFDEADALFGKRSEVKDSHDRYANIEVGYLLQRMENHNGLVILTTNRKKDLDEAFLRRLRYVIQFPPNTEES
ncbi:MAG TPA: ATP-binding protein [Pyrinomonadaceae bacterium]|nr:ATP-binding protein [Pyrinomonadaceae bacterium]